jgi:endonuclease/exonuclease/phosphatase (EEP) superfamily protein YafD
VNRELPRRQRFLRTAAKISAGGYLFGLALYLVLRFTFGDRFWWLALLHDFAPLFYLPLPIILLIAWLLRSRRLIALALVHSLIVGLWLGPRFLPRRPVTSSGATLRVVTFNVWGNNTRLKQVQEWLCETDADVIVLQEIPERYANHQIPELADLYPYQVSQSTATRWWGNLFLSRHPILSAEDLPGEGVPAQQRFAIDWKGQTLAVYNIHFAMPIGAPRLPGLKIHYVLQTALSYNNSARNAEITRLLTRLETEPHPYIVAGDFNMSEYATIYDKIAETMQDSYRETKNGWGGTWPISIVEELPRFVPPLLRTDYVWHSEHFCTVEAQRGPALGSDHLPLHVKLELSDIHQEISQCTN